MSSALVGSCWFNKDEEIFIMAVPAHMMGAICLYNLEAILGGLFYKARLQQADAFHHHDFSIRMYFQPNTQGQIG